MSTFTGHSTTTVLFSTFPIGSFGKLRISKRCFRHCGCVHYGPWQSQEVLQGGLCCLRGSVLPQFSWSVSSLSNSLRHANLFTPSGIQQACVVDLDPQPGLDPRPLGRLRGPADPSSHSLPPLAPLGRGFCVSLYLSFCLRAVL